MKLLLADDSKFMRFKLREICESFSQQLIIEEAGTGLEAVKKCEPFQPDVVFMDITMPQMDGLEAAKIIKERWPKIKVVICSAIAETQKAKESVSFGIDDIIAKPFTPEQINKLLTRFSPKA